MKQKTFLKILNDHKACEDAVKWSKSFDTWQDLWNSCERGDWMLWIVGKYSAEPFSDKRKPLVLAACECARLSLKYVQYGEARPLAAIEIAERWSKGESVKEQDVKDAAAAAAAAAADAASAAAYAAAADAASYAAYAAAANSAAYAASAAAYAAAAAADAASASASASAAADAANSAAKIETLQKCEKIARKHFPNFEPK